jgi:hypothetical protein
VLIEKVEKLRIVIHQKCCVLATATRVVSLGFAKGVAIQMVGKHMNWALYAKWTNYEQQ